ncbi:MAG: S41 family peptidase [Phycisphaerales bacterium]
MLRVRHWAAIVTVVAGFAIRPSAVVNTARAAEGWGSATVLADEWSQSVWTTASRGDAKGLMELLDKAPAGNETIAKAVQRLKSNLAAREAKRAEEETRIRKELDETLASDGGDLGLSQGLRSAVALSLVVTDKLTVPQEPKIKKLIQDADVAAHAAEARGDWLMASELYYRLHLLLEEHGTYRDDVFRERRRLEVIRLYAPERFWELRSKRRDAEIAWNKAHKKPEAAKGAGEDEDEEQPLPPYNPTGDDFRQKLAGIDEGMIREAMGRAFGKHVERTPMEKILRGGIDAVRTVATTTDLSPTFAGLADEASRAEMLRFLAAEDDRIAKSPTAADGSDLNMLVDRLVDMNERTIKLPKVALLHEFTNGGMDALDEFSAVIWPDEIRRFNKNTQGHFFGVGIQIEQDPIGNIKVVAPMEGTPAHRAGVRTGDIIKKVNGASTIGFTLDQAVDNITGPLDTKVLLTLEREEADEEGKTTRKEIDLPLVRARIEVSTVKGWKKAGPGEDNWDWFVDPSNKIGYVRITNFAEKTDGEFDRAIAQMKAQGLAGLVMDLRFNPGGLLDQAVAISNRFIDPSTPNPFGSRIVSTHRKDGTVVEKQTARRAAARLTGLPVVVLINEGSASASEIVSGALRDYSKAEAGVKALLVGQRTFGKGSVQNVWPLRGGAEAAVKVTTNYYHLPGNSMIHRLPAATQWGVDPNLQVNMLPQQIVDALRARSNSDVTRNDGKPVPAKPDGAKPEGEMADTSGLPAVGQDLQLEHAWLVLLTQVPAPANQALLDKPGHANP